MIWNSILRSYAMKAAVFASFAALAACGTAGPSSSLSDLVGVETAQGSAENIASLSAVIQRSPSDPNAYNVRGAAFGRAGRYHEALKDFDQAIALDRQSYQAYANRALIHRYMGDNQRAIADYSQSIAL